VNQVNYFQGLDALIEKTSMYNKTNAERTALSGSRDKLLSATSPQKNVKLYLCKVNLGKATKSSRYFRMQCPVIDTDLLPSLMV